MSKTLRTGYTTGTHATAVLLACLHEYFQASTVDQLEITLPQGQKALIEVQKEGSLHFSTIKGDNDDIDVTKGCRIGCKLSHTPPQGLQSQTPSLIEPNGMQIFIYAGEGVGVVTKKGLKIAPYHPAINPTPLEMMLTNATNIVPNTNKSLYVTFYVKNGEQIAKETANAKVGVIGGISILGTRGIVKPVSASAYIDSIQAEIAVAAEESQEQIIFTLGNTAHDYAKKHYNETSIIEIGNFVYDAAKQLQKHAVKRVIFITSIAKMCKVAQGFQNTHNRYGSIDFDKVQHWIESEIGYTMPTEEFVTLKGVLQTLPTQYHTPFVKLLGYKSACQLQRWFEELGLAANEVQTITLPNNIKETLQW